MTRIAMISEHASPLAAPGSRDSGGQNVYVAAVARGLAGLGNEVDVFTRRDDPALPPVADWLPGVRVVHVPAGPAAPVPKERLLPWMDEFAGWMVKHCRETRYDAVHANFWMSALVASRLKAELGLPFAVTFHALGRVRRLYQGEADQFPPEREAIEQEAIDAASAIIAECPQDFADLQTWYHVCPSRIAIIPCGFDPAEFSPGDRRAARRSLGLPPSHPVILQLGRIVPRKGVDTVIEALVHLRDRHALEPRLLVVGSEDGPEPGGPEFDRLRAIAESGGVSHLVDFRGRHDRAALPAFYRAADVFVTTPWYEPFGITPLEAMACGTPVVGAAVGGIQHTVVDGQTGFLVPPRDPAALAARLGLLLRDESLRARLGNHAACHVRSHFTWETAVLAIDALLADIALGVSGQRSPAGLAFPAGSPAETTSLEFAARVAVLDRSRRELPLLLTRAAAAIGRAFRNGHKLLICGNGGSAAEAQHFATELVGRFRLTGRPGLPAIALSADSSFITAWSNDVDFRDVFARQVEALGNRGDVLLGISTSGRSQNVLRALTTARARGLVTIGLLGVDGGLAAGLSDIAITVPSDDTQHVQEVQLMAIHILCGLIESALHQPPSALAHPELRRNGRAAAAAVTEMR